MIGRQLGPYHVIARIGEGGMGEVYRARDERLRRDVAIKTLPDLVSADRERLARFEREAQTLAALSHPHIATVFGLEEGPGGIRALVMELVEGETLEERIAQGPMPWREALAIARQIADGLEAAHERGIIHRDLKPANVKLTPDGSVKVLDFGLAKAMESGAGSRESGIGETLANSPTIASPAITQAGVILGTAAYMAPEQARGKSVDRRADIWSFGCVLYELLTGRRTFAGEEITDVLARLLERDPDWSLLPTATPIELRRLLARCLTKDPKARLRDIGEARVVIDELLSGKPAAPMPIAARSTTGSRPTVAVALPWTLAVLFAAAAAYALMPSPAAPVVTTPIHAQLSLPRRPHGSTIVPRVASGSVEPMVKAQRC